MYALDSGALLAVIKFEEGAALVRQILRDNRGKCVIHAVNLMEIYYGCLRAGGSGYADKVLDTIARAGIEIRNDLDIDFLRDASFHPSITKCRSLILSPSHWRGVSTARWFRPTITNSTRFMRRAFARWNLSDKIMDVTQFWGLIEDSRNGLNSRTDDAGCEQQADNLKVLLAEFSPDEIARFDAIFDEFEAQAYRWDLWGAAYVINGGASDDGFAYFCWWLIAQGQTYFENALADAENAGDNLEEGEVAECEDIRYRVYETYEEKTGAEIPPSPVEKPAEPLGQPWKEDDLPTLYPRLWQKFG